jgi:integrase/recombinase XerD
MTATLHERNGTMSKRKTPPRPPETALVPSRPAQLAPPPNVLDGQLVPHAGPSADPLDAFLAACDERSRGTMRARLDAAARFLSPGSTAERYPWVSLDHVAVQHVVTNLPAVDRAGKVKLASPATRNLTRAALRLMARTLFKLRLMSIDERQRVDDVRPARGKRLPRGRALTEAELRKLFRVCERDATAAGLRDAALLAVLYGGGLRRDEASKLDVCDLDAAGLALRVQGKGDREAAQPIVAEVAAAVQAWLEIRGQVRGEDAQAMFLTVDKSGRVGDRRLDGKAIAWKVDRRAREAGIPPLADGHVCSPHDLRRSYGTGLLDRGEDLATVAKAMRHASVATSAIYDRRDERAVVAAVAKLRVPVGR